jgi:hypothetical protein
MRKQIIFFVITLMFLQIAIPVGAVEFCADFLESGNPGGWEKSKKTCDQKAPKDLGKEAEVDIWLKGVPEEIITAGFWLSYDPSQVSIVSAEIYDGSVLKGPWDGSMTKKVENPSGKGTYLVTVGNLANVKPDKKGDVIIGKIKYLCKDKCTKPITLITIQGFDTVVGGEGKVYDPEIKKATIKIH